MARRFKSIACAAPVAVAVAIASLAWCAARAEPVPIGRYAEIPIGISQRSPYPTSAGDAHRSGRTRARAPTATPARIWSVVLPHRRLTPPSLLEDGTLIVGSDGGVYALDPDSGQARWFAAVGAVRGTPSLTPGGELVAVAAGKLVWIDGSGRSRTTELTAELTGALLVLESGNVVVAGRDGQLHVVAGDGAYLASVPLPTLAAHVRWLASAGGDRIVAAGDEPHLIVFALQGGNERPSDLGASAASSPIVADDETIWTLSTRGTLWAVGPDGRARLSMELGQGSPRMADALGWDGALRVALPYGEIVNIGARGDERWRRGIDAPPGAMLIDHDDTTLVASARGTLYAIDRRGEVRWRVGLEARGVGRPVLGRDGSLYLVARGGVVQAWR